MTRLPPATSSRAVLEALRTAINARNPGIEAGQISQNRKTPEAWHLFRTWGFIPCHVMIEPRRDGRRVLRLGTPGSKRVNLLEPREGWDLDALVAAALPLIFSVDSDQVL